MSTPKISAAKMAAVEADIMSGCYSRDEIAERNVVGNGTVSRVRQNMGINTDFGYRVDGVIADKKEGTFNWRDAITAIQGMQQIKKKMSWSQDEANITLGDGRGPVILMAFGDQHIGAYGTNYEEFVRLTDEIISTPNLYIALIGDYLEMAIRLRGVLEVTSQVLTPEMQEAFLEG